MQSGRPVFITTLLLLTMLLITAAPVFSADDEREQLKAFKLALKSTEEADRLKAVSEYGVLPGKSIGKQLRKVVTGDRSDRVRAAAARAIGSRRNKKDISFLLSTFKSLKKRPVALAGAIDGVGFFGEPKTADAVYDAGRLWLTKHKYPALATIQALGRIRSGESVELLMKLYDLTYPRAGYGPGADGGGSIDGSAPTGSGMTNDDTRAALGDFRPHIIAALQGITGEMLDDLDNWQEWWREVEDTFDPATVKIDPNRQLKLVDSTCSYQIKRPGSEWKWQEKPKEGYSRTAVLTEDDEVTAYLHLLAYSTMERGPRDAKTLAAEEKERLKGMFTELSEENFDEAIKVDGVDAIRHTAAGVKGMESAYHRVTFVGRRDYIYVLWFTLTDSAGRGTQESVREFEGSFKFLQ